jgi:hypothetical protein
MILYLIAAPKSILARQEKSHKKCRESGENSISTHATTIKTGGAVKYLRRWQSTQLFFFGAHIFIHPCSVPVVIVDHDVE